ncbi:hypothetical protein [Halorhabdus sp. CUG00001]|uniref:hypothetical protein n=1 Tax=Halorhabdus sp. CUG00001 TaxID=2600297 RepID=UPI00131B4E7C|nr:hypothetical protein [Halorhabdus sp. CUG00001]
MSEAFSRGKAVIWAISLGILTAFTAGSLVTVQTARQGMVITGLWLVFSSAVLYVLVVENWDQWAREQPLVRIVVYFAPLFFGTVVLDATLSLIVGWQGLLTTVLDTLVAGLVFAGAIWLSFYRGADLVREYVVDKLDAEW